MKTQRPNFRRRLIKKQRQRWLKLALLAVVGFLVLSLLFNVVTKLPQNSSKPVDAILVLGGSIKREIYAAKLAKEYRDLPILISAGSKDPCILFIFQRYRARLNNVWLEKCADSTFGNFFYSVPILRSWGVHKVKVITSRTHLPRAKWLAQIHLGAQGIAVEMDLAKEKGIPGNHENQLKTILDVSRSLLWAVASQVIYPSCSNFIALDQVDLNAWQKQEYECEAQGKIQIKQGKGNREKGTGNRGKEKRVREKRSLNLLHLS